MKKRVTKAQVEYIAPLTDTIMHLVLKPAQYIDYQAGQYLTILDIPSQPLSYSIANAPLGSKHYELHIRHCKDNPYNQALFVQIKKLGYVTVQLPFGSCCFENLDPHRPISFMAGGTGFAPVNAMIEQLLADLDSRSFDLFWGVRNQSDVYLNEKVVQWKTHAARFEHYSFVSEASKENLLQQFLRLHLDDLCARQLVIAGPFEMAYSIRDALVERGMPSEQMFSDAFSFA